MPAPYTIEQVASVSGLTVKFIRRMKDALPQLFEKHTERGHANALLFDESIAEVLKRTKELRNRGRTLQQIREELSALASGGGGEGRPFAKVSTFAYETSAKRPEGRQGDVKGPLEEPDFMHMVLERENVLLRSQVDLLQNLLKRAEERYDRLLPAATTGTSAQAPLKQEAPLRQGFEGQGLKAQLLLWLVEAVVVTAFASGFIFLIWFFAQKAFRI